MVVEGGGQGNGEREKGEEVGCCIIGLVEERYERGRSSLGIIISEDPTCIPVFHDVGIDKRHRVLILHS